jgi:hypothetical protein
VILDQVLPPSTTAPNGLNQSFYDMLSKEIAEAVLKCDNKVPVVTGSDF